MGDASDRAPGAAAARASMRALNVGLPRHTTFPFVLRSGFAAAKTRLEGRNLEPAPRSPFETPASRAP